MRNRCLEVLTGIRWSHPDLKIKGMKQSPSDVKPEVATLELHNGMSVRVALLEGIARTDVVRQGLLAHERMPQAADKAVTMLVVEGLDIHDPIVLTSRVLITNLQPDVIAEGLRRLASLG